MESTDDVVPPIPPRAYTTAPNGSPNGMQILQQQKNDNTPDVLLEGWMLKRSRNNYWQDRYFTFRSDQTISYRRNQDDVKPKVTFRVSTEAGCEVSDLFVAQRSIGPGVSGGSVAGTGKKETLYCVTLSWPDDNETTATSIVTQQTAGNDATSTGGGGPYDSFRDDESFLATPMDALTPTSPLSVTSHKQRGLRRKFRLSTKGTEGNDDGSLKSAQSLGSRASQIRKSVLRRRPLKRGRSAPSTDNIDRQIQNGFDYDDRSIASLLDPPKRSVDDTLLMNIPSTPKNKDLQSSPSRNPANTASLFMSMPNIKVDLRPRPNKIPTEVKMDIMEENDEDVDISNERPPKSPIGNQQKGNDFDLVPLNDMKETLRRSLKDEYGVITPTTVDKKVSYEEQTLQEQEMLHSIFLRKQREQRTAMTKRAVSMTKVAVAASAAIGVGIITAGVGLAAGLVFLGGAAAVGGTAGVAEAGLRRTLKRKDHMTIATANYELAKLWKTMLDSCLEQESLKRSTWGQLFVADGRKTTTTLIAHDAGDIMHVFSGDDEDGHHSGAQPNSSKDRPKRQTNVFLRDPKFLSEARARWRPLDGGWVSLLGPGGPSFRIFKEERIRVRVDETKKVAQLAVRGSTTPLRTQVVLNAHPMEAFMCIMSYARMTSKELTPNSGQSASFRLIEKVDEHTDVLHLVCRKLFLFPSWTEARDYVLLRYWRYEPDGSYVICYESMEHPGCPPQPGFVRGDLHQVYTIAPPKASDHRRLRGTAHAAEECMLTAVVQVDPKGWVPTKPLSLLSGQSYTDAFGISALFQTLDIRDAIENDRFLDTSPDLHPSPSMTKDDTQSGNVVHVSDLRYVGRERCDSFTSEKFPDIGSHPKPLSSDRWAEPDSNSFLVRGPTYKSDRVKVNAGSSIGQLIAVDVVHVDEPLYGGMSMHPSERIQIALEREKRLKAMGKQSDVPPFIFVVNIILPTDPVHHGVFYFAVDDMSTIDGSDGSPSSKLCQKFLFGDSDEFRDNTFKLIPRIVEGNFLVRKAVGSTPAIMGTKLKQYYVRNERFMEVILDCGSSPVATGVIRLSLGYAKTLVVDMGFLLEGDTEEHLPERVFGAVRIKYPTFGPHLRTVHIPNANGLESR